MQQSLQLSVTFWISRIHSPSVVSSHPVMPTFVFSRSFLPPYRGRPPVASNSRRFMVTMTQLRMKTRNGKK